MRNWLLPENVEDILPPDAICIEHLRRKLLDLYRVHGYQLVIPPLLEYLESLLTGTGEDLDLKTFKLVDGISGRMMGVRADITPQVARIDAHLLNRSGVMRLCYCGSVLQTSPRGLTGTREPLQIGAEIYGHGGIESDQEIQSLLFKSLQLCGVNKVHIDLGHVAIFRSICRYGAVSGSLETALYGALESKDAGQLILLTKGLEGRTKDALLALPNLYGDQNIIKEARRVLPTYQEITDALNALQQLSEDSGYLVNIDLADLRGYHYHSGVVFAAYAPGRANAIALGGRYDEVGKAFGRARPATGFSMDLRDLIGIVPPLPHSGAILAPSLPDDSLRSAIDALRASGEVVIVDLPGHDAPHDELNCDRKLVAINGQWQVKARLSDRDN